MQHKYLGTSHPPEVPYSFANAHPLLHSLAAAHTNQTETVSKVANFEIVKRLGASFDGFQAQT